MSRRADPEPTAARSGSREDPVGAIPAVVVALLCVAGPTGILLGVSGAPQTLLMTAALVGAPALACSILAGFPDRVLSIAVGLAGSFSTLVLISTCLLYLGVWSPLVLTSVSSVVTLVTLAAADHLRGLS